MSNAVELSKELKIEIEKEPLVIEYRRIKTLLDNDKEIQSLKKQIALAKAHQDNELHKSYLDKYNSHPLVINYLSLKEDVSEFLLEISKIINKK